MKYKLGTVVNFYNLHQAIAEAIHHIGRVSDADFDKIRLRLTSLTTSELAYKH